MNRIMNFSRDLVGVLASPEEALSRVKELGVENQGLYLYVFLSAFLGYMIGGVISAATGAGIMVPVLFALAGLVVSFIKLIVWALISHIIATVVFKGKGTFAGTLKMMGFAAAPFVVGIFAIITLTLLGTFFTSSMLFVVMYIWTVMIAAAAVAAEHEMGYGRAFLSVFALPAIIITLLMMLAGVL
ncbi:YIP1 family protein [Methanothermobacter sp.]|uniref:YIP1 family protein n=1 Tax=Methanothermobacter sp. TaxID=1884223 RepID=UPI002636941A|nr:YIP1 family protein [Methanothermobacter sp.]MDI9615340.1 YIP1 family protein [Methanothermobacter sp.]